MKRYDQTKVSKTIIALEAGAPTSVEVELNVINKE